MFEGVLDHLKNGHKKFYPLNNSTDIDYRYIL